ncbi:MAG: hypothetical protein MK289_17710 [Trichodesmium sp. ALOHA_ZT_67]|nr:hypothetical protein [Trichodesmium sp. ALOHA_ZT_67]
MTQQKVMEKLQLEIETLKLSRETALLHECCDRNFSPEEKLISEERILLCSFLADNSVSYD